MIITYIFSFLVIYAHREVIEEKFVEVFESYTMSTHYFRRVYR